MKVGKPPNSENISITAQYFEVSMEYLSGMINNPTPPNKELTKEQKFLV